MTLTYEDQSDDDIAMKEWGRTKAAKLNQKMKAMADKKMMERKGVKRYPFQGVCGCCESNQEQVLGVIIDLCGHCREKFQKRWTDKKIYFKILSTKLNNDVLYRKCQVCNRKDIVISQVNIMQCLKCQQRGADLDRRANSTREQEKHAIRMIRK